MKTFKIVLGIFMTSLTAAVIIFTYYYYLPRPAKDFGNETKYLLVRRGDSVDKIAENLVNLGAVPSKSRFTFFARILRKANLLKVGRYAIKPHNSLSYLMGTMTRGESTPFNVTIPEGYTMAQIANLLEATVEINIGEFRDIVTSRAYLDSLKIQASHLEGYLAPSTYNLYFAENAKHLVNKLVSHFFQTLPDSFEIKAARLGLTLHQAVTLASMIEKEAMLDDERPIIAAVYLNRLRKGMRMECDPTVIYALGGLGRQLLRTDLVYDSPYNTYRNYGLPPGPIANPGVKSLLAAVEPAHVGFLYFVARGDGSHIFTCTLQDHIDATAKARRSNGHG